MERERLKYTHWPVTARRLHSAASALVSSDNSAQNGKSVAL